MLRLSHPDAVPWDVAIGEPGWARAPIATWIGFVSESTGYLADVVGRRVVHEVAGAIRTAEDELHDLVLFAGDGLTAVGPDGIAWVNPGPWVDLKVERIGPDAIVCSVLTQQPVRPEIRIDPCDGSLLGSARR